MVRPISEISSCFFGPRPWHTEIRHRVNKKTSTINLFGFETLKLKIRRLKLWKPTVCPLTKRGVPLFHKDISFSYSVRPRRAQVCIPARACLCADVFFVGSRGAQKQVFKQPNSIKPSTNRGQRTIYSIARCQYYIVMVIVLVVRQ